MPRELTPDEVTGFRTELSAVALDLFTERGYAGVTMREIARRVGCSAMTPYRYFANKAEIFDAVRSECFARFGEWIEREMAPAADIVDPLEKLRGLGHCYVAFALAEPRAYRIMFEVETIDAAELEAVAEGDRETWYLLVGAARSAVESGALSGDPELLAHLYWASLHGIVSLHHAGRLQLGKSLQDLVEPALDMLAGGRS